MKYVSNGLICLILDPENFSDDINHLIKHHKSLIAFLIKDAAAPLSVFADIERRTIGCSMELTAPRDKKTTKARINWLLRQVSKANAKNVVVYASWPSITKETSQPLGVLRDDPTSLQALNPKIVPTKFRIALIMDIAGKFSGTKTFLNSVNEVVPEFYGSIGEHLNVWVPTPPKLPETEE